MSGQIHLETEENSRPVIDIQGIPEKTNDVLPFSFKNDSSSEGTVSIKSSSPKRSPIREKFKNKLPPNYSLYADPKKMARQEEESEDEEYSESDDENSDEESMVSKESVQSVLREQKRPALSRIQLKIKKKEMLLKLHEAEKNGYALTGKYNMNSELEEMEAEYELYEKKLEQSTMVDFLQDGLMFVIKGIEVMNGIYNPLNVKLGGLSDQIYDRREKLEHVFRRLAVKYSGGTEMPPELSLLFIIGGAMIMTHISNTALQGGGMGGLGSLLGNTNIMESVSKIMQSVSPQAPVPQNAPTNDSARQQEMKPPNIDIANLLSSMTKTQPTKPVDKRDTLPFKAMNVPEPSPFPKSTRTSDYGSKSSKDVNDDDRFSLASSVTSSEDESTVNISVPSRRSSKQKRSIQI